MLIKKNEERREVWKRHFIEPTSMMKVEGRTSWE